MKNIKPIFIASLSAIALNAYANTVNVPFLNEEVTPENSLTANYKLGEREAMICSTRVGSEDATIEWEFQGEKFTHPLPVFLKKDGKLNLDLVNSLHITTQKGTSIVSCQILDLL